MTDKAGTDTLELLRIEHQVAWGASSPASEGDTVAVMLLSEDGRSAVLPGLSAVRADMGSMSTHISRSWLIHPTEVPSPPEGLIVVTTGDHWQAPAGWRNDEWAELLSGDLGPWAAVVSDHQVVSLAHSARLDPLGLEVGVQTEDRYLNRGLATVAVLAWADEARTLGQPLFYSADEDNPASHQVAAKIGGEFLGLTIRTELVSS